MKYKNCFLGIPLPASFFDAYKDLQVRLREIDPSLTLQDPEKLEPHITIYYLDEQTEDALSEISKIVEESKDILKGLTLKVGGMDFFQKQEYNVLFLDIVYPKELVIFPICLTSQSCIYMLGIYLYFLLLKPFHNHQSRLYVWERSFG